MELVATLEVQHSIPLGNPCLTFMCSGMASETLCSVIGLTAITAPFTDPHQFMSPLPERAQSPLPPGWIIPTTSQSSFDLIAIENTESRGQSTQSPCAPFALACQTRHWVPAIQQCPKISCRMNHLRHKPKLWVIPAAMFLHRLELCISAAASASFIQRR